MTVLRQLGSSDLAVSAIGMGAWQFSQGSGVDGHIWRNLSDEAIVAIVKAGLEGGVNWFDTAEGYGFGSSERALARALASLGHRAEGTVVATKWLPLARFAGSLRRTIDRRLSALGVETIDLHQVHHPWSFSSIEAQMDAMADLVEAGRVRYVGVSNFSAEQMRAADQALRARGRRLVSNQVPYSLLNRRIERDGTLAAARQLGVSIIAYSPLLQGVLTGKYHDGQEEIRRLPLFRRLGGRFRPAKLQRSKPLIEALGRLADLYGVSPAQVALNWVANYQGELVVAIPGATSPRQARENAAAMGSWLKRAELEWLAEVSAPLAF